MLYCATRNDAKAREMTCGNGKGVDGVNTQAPDRRVGVSRQPTRGCALLPGYRLFDISRFMGHNKVTTTLAVYAHLINTDDHSGNMAALGALATGPTPSYSGNVVPLHG